MSAYISIDPELLCLREGHRFSLFGSDKTPLKRSLQCDTCTAALGKTVIVAYGDDTKSFGRWRQMRRREDEPTLDEVIE